MWIRSWIANFFGVAKRSSQNEQPCSSPPLTADADAGTVFAVAAAPPRLTSAVARVFLFLFLLAAALVPASDAAAWPAPNVWGGAKGPEPRGPGSAADAADWTASLNWGGVRGSEP